MVVGTLLEVVHKTGYYSDTMKNVAMRVAGLVLDYIVLSQENQ